MKKVLALLLIAIIGLFAFVACNPDSSLNEELVNVTITSRDTRSLEASTDFDISSVTKWTYTAEKADNGLKTGATETEVELKDGKTQQLSQGSWNFKLFGYKDEKLICSGKTTDPTTITVDKHTITILVGPQQTGEGRGTIEIKDDIKIVDKNGNSVADNSTEYTKTVTVKNSTGTVISDFSSVNSGMYYVEVVYTATAKDGTKYVAASAKKYFNVYDNLTTTISGTVEETTQSGEANPEAEKVVASVDGVYYESIKDALLASSKDKPLVLLKDATLEKAIEITKDATIDLGSYILDLKGQLSIKGSTEGSKATLTIKNGTLNSDASGSNVYGIAIEANGALEMSDVEYLASSRAIKIKENADNASLKIINSQIISNGGAMAIQTDATIKDGKASQNVTIEITNSHIEAKNCTEGGGVSEDTTALLFNIDGTLTIKESTLIGDRQGLIVRGGTATISNSTIISSGTRTNYYDSGDYVNKNWGSGNEVPLAALVVGNRTDNSYRYSTTVTLDNVTLSTPNENTVRKSIYVYQNDTTNTVTVTGNIKGECTVNAENTRNGALVFPEAKIGDTYYQTLSNALDSVSKNGNANIELSSGLTTELPPINEKTITFIGDGSQTFDMSTSAVTCSGSNLTFKNVNFKGSTSNYIGIQHVKTVIYDNCSFTAKRFLYGENETFNKCSFTNEDGDYCVWTYGASNVNFNMCKFYGNKKCIYIYNEGEVTVFNVSIKECIFNGGSPEAGKAAIETGDTNHTLKQITLNISDSDFSNWFGTENNSQSNIWGNKDNLGADKLSVTIDGSRVYLKRIVTSSELQEALTKLTGASSGNNTIEIADDLSLKEGEIWTPATIAGYQGAGVITINGNGHKISGLNAPLLAGGFAGNSGVVINNLTLDNVNISDNTNSQGLGAFISCIDSMPKIELNNCHLTNSKITSAGGARVGGLIGWTSGYNNPNNGPVDTYITIKNCSVENCEITAKGSVGGIIGHAGANPATYHTIENCIVTGNKLNSTDAGGWRVGVVVGTANVGEVTISKITESENTLTQTDKTAPEGQSNFYGRFVPGTTGKLTID